MMLRYLGWQVVACLTQLRCFSQTLAQGRPLENPHWKIMDTHEISQIEAISPSQPDADDTPETTITVRLAVALKESLRQNAEARGINLSDYVRAKVAGDSLPKRRLQKRKLNPIERELLVELNRIGTNLNQAVRKLNAQNNQGFADRQMLIDLLVTIQRVALALSSEGSES